MLKVDSAEKPPVFGRVSAADGRGLVFDTARVLPGIGGRSADREALATELMVSGAKEEEKRPFYAAFPY